MGRKRQRKQTRQLERRQARARNRPSWYSEIEPSSDELLAILLEQDRDRLPEPENERCGQCAEFVEDELTSRGSCLHPGSGIVSPWTDTPGCDFFKAARRRTVREFHH